MNLELSPCLLTGTNPGSTFTDCTAPELIYPLKLVKRLPRCHQKGFSKRAAPSLAELQQQFREDQLTTQKLSSFDKFFLLKKFGYGLKWNPKAVSNGLAAALIHAGHSQWHFAQVLANTQLPFACALDWLRQWLQLYYPDYLDLLDRLLPEIRSLRSLKDFELVNIRPYSRRLFDGQVIKGDSLLYVADFVQIEVEENSDGAVVDVDKHHKPPCEHTRKAHRRRVRYGKGRQFTRWVEISETVVNEGVA